MVALVDYSGICFCNCDFNVFLIFNLTRQVKKRIYAMSPMQGASYRGVEQPGSSSGS